MTHMYSISYYRVHSCWYAPSTANRLLCLTKGLLRRLGCLHLVVFRAVIEKMVDHLVAVLTFILAHKTIQDAPALNLFLASRYNNAC